MMKKPKARARAKARAKKPKVKIIIKTKAKKLRARRKTNGRSRNARDVTALARARVLKAAKRDGVISNAAACKIGKWSQSWYHLSAMVRAGQLRRSGYNQWLPVLK